MCEASIAPPDVTWIRRERSRCGEKVGGLVMNLHAAISAGRQERSSRYGAGHEGLRAEPRLEPSMPVHLCGRVGHRSCPAPSRSAAAIFNTISRLVDSA
jgi:hypothetical protein